jgi:hypothetical protein
MAKKNQHVVPLGNGFGLGEGGHSEARPVIKHECNKDSQHFFW